MVLTDSHGISRAPCYLGYSPGGTQHYSYGAHTLSGRPFKTVHLCLHLTSLVRQNQNGKSHNPAHATPAGYHTWKRFSLIRVRSPLLTESLLFSLPAGTEMFHFPAFPPTALYIQTAATPHDGCQVSPFGNPRIKVWLPTPRGISQAPTSFIGS